nr:MAG TPA: hypothetical protein [Caudoviricetes sp.]
MRSIFFCWSRIILSLSIMFFLLWISSERTLYYSF